MNEFQVKLAKWASIFFIQPATLKIDTTKLEISKEDGTIVLSSSFTDLKKANYNSINGIWTLVSTNGQKCNVIVKDRQAVEQLRSNMAAAGVKGLVI